MTYFSPMNINIVNSQPTDLDAILQLYTKVAAIPGGIIRIPTEITQSYVADFLSKSWDTGVSLVAKNDESGAVLGEIHAYTYGLSAFRHILTDLTIVVDPEFQGQQIGRKLFTAFLQHVRAHFTHILRVELFVREKNTKAIRFYEELGFCEEGRHNNKILNTDGSLETPIEMVWMNPDFTLQDSYEAQK
jgi:ribosomal protein S18 acetylase RimI-like enzyme